MFSAHCGIAAGAGPVVVADTCRNLPVFGGSLCLTAILRCDASHPLRWCLVIAVGWDASGPSLRKDNRTDGDESVARPYFCVCVLSRPVPSLASPPVEDGAAGEVLVWLSSTDDVTAAPR